MARWIGYHGRMSALTSSQHITGANKSFECVLFEMSSPIERLQHQLGNNFYHNVAARKSPFSLDCHHFQYNFKVI